jgi:RNA recognition motif-containing protein
MSEKIATGQTPSKVLHIRNLPYETTQEELEDLSRSFGRLVKTKLNVGANRNQAFIEFPDIQSAVNMVHHFMSSAEPAKVIISPFCFNRDVLIFKSQVCLWLEVAAVRHAARRW